MSLSVLNLNCLDTCLKLSWQSRLTHLSPPLIETHWNAEVHGLHLELFRFIPSRDLMAFLTFLVRPDAVVQSTLLVKVRSGPSCAKEVQGVSWMSGPMAWLRVFTKKSLGMTLWECGASRVQLMRKKWPKIPKAPARHCKGQASGHFELTYGLWLWSCSLFSERLKLWDGKVLAKWVRTMLIHSAVFSIKRNALQIL